MDKRYIKNVDGNSFIKFRKDIVVNDNGSYIFNPSVEDILKDGWVEYIEEENTIETPSKDSFKEVQLKKIEQILNYDSSENVNKFYVNGFPMWLDKATRVGLELRFKSEKMKGKTDTVLWYNGIPFPLKVDVAIFMLYEIESYASECYDNTQKHIANILKLDMIESIKEYDYTVGYPNKLMF